MCLYVANFALSENPMGWYGSFIKKIEWFFGGFYPNKQAIPPPCLANLQGENTKNRPVFFSKIAPKPLKGNSNLLRAILGKFMYYIGQDESYALVTGGF